MLGKAYAATTPLDVLAVVYRLRDGQSGHGLFFRLAGWPAKSLCCVCGISRLRRNPANGEVPGTHRPFRWLMLQT